MLLTLIAYRLRRTTGLPNATDDIGNWGEPLEAASLIVEGVIVILSAVMLGRCARASPQEVRAAGDAPGCCGTV